MADKSVEERMKKVVAEIFGKKSSQISRDTDFVADLHAKSIDMVELIAGVEEEFKIPVNQGECIKNQTVGQAIDWMNKKLKEMKAK